MRTQTKCILFHLSVMNAFQFNHGFHFPWSNNFRIIPPPPKPATAFPPPPYCWSFFCLLICLIVGKYTVTPTPPHTHTHAHTHFHHHLFKCINNGHKTWGVQTSTASEICQTSAASENWLYQSTETAFYQLRDRKKNKERRIGGRGK